MLIFTKEYEKFCDALRGEYIHHQPNLAKEDSPEKRALFEWIYSKCFQIYPQSSYLYRGFFLIPLPKKIIEEFSNESIDFLKDKYFRRDSSFDGVVDYIIQEMKQDVQESNQADKEELLKNKINTRKMYQKEGYTLNYLVTPMLYFSMYESDAYHQYMLANKKERNHSACSTYYGCTSCESKNSSNSGESDSSGSSSSSCSSCSSCGGGGD